MAKYAAMTVPKGSLLHNEDAIWGDKNRPDLNQGGGPHGVRNKPRVQAGARGGYGHQGRDKVAVRASMGGGRGSSGNPASRGGFSGEARGGAFVPEKRVPGHGGSPQVRERNPGPPAHGGYGASGKEGVVNQYANANPQPDTGNTSGRSYRLIAGRFKRAAMGARASGGESSGRYGSAPVTANT